MDRARANRLDLLGLALLIAILGVLAWRITAPGAVAGPPVAPGTAMPAVDAAGWLNLPAGESFDPSGKVVVVDLWATYCPPCRAEIPRLAKVARQYRPLGVEFVGLTDETAAQVPAIREFIDQTPGFDWPVGYGVRKFTSDLNIRGIPTLIVFGADGRARWSWLGAGPQGLELAIDEALLAAKKAASREPKAG